MNIHIAIITLFAVKLIFKLYLEHINAGILKAKRAAGYPLPSDHSDIMSKEEYQKSVDYTLTKSYFSLVSLLIDAVVFFVVLYSGVIGWFYTLTADTLTFLPVVVRESLFIFGFYFFLKLIFSLPLEWYQNFRIEARYGFNTMGMGLWVSDFIKGSIISLVFMTFLLSIIFYLVNVAGILWWVWGWGAFVVFQLVMFLLYPMVIMPLFNKFTPLGQDEREGMLRKKIMELAAKLKFSAKEILVMDGSRRSKHSNAFFTGIGKGRRVVFFDTLVEQLSIDEMQAVFAHEVGHFKKKHITKMMVMAILQVLVFFYLVDFLNGATFFNSAFGLEVGNLAHTLILLSFLGELATFWFKPFSNYFSRKNEYEADAYAKVAVGEGTSLISALKKLYKKNLSNLTPHRWYSFFYYSHPTLFERAEALDVDK